MALVVQTLVSDLISRFNSIDVENGAISNEELITQLAEAIDTYIKTGDVIVAGGSSSGSYKVI